MSPLPPRYRKDDESPELLETVSPWVGLDLFGEGEEKSWSHYKREEKLPLSSSKMKAGTEEEEGPSVPRF